MLIFEPIGNVDNQLPMIVIPDGYIDLFQGDTGLPTLLRSPNCGGKAHRRPVIALKIIVLYIISFGGHGIHRRLRTAVSLPSTPKNVS